MNNVLDEYNNILKKYYGYESLKKEQFKIINEICNKKKDVLAILATGFGKSITYQLPFLINKKCVIVVSPLIYLIEDQVNQLNKLKIPCFNFSDTEKSRSIEKKEILNGSYKILFMTPEYLVLNTEFIDNLYNKDGISCFAIDESHCVSNWSDDSFRPEYGQLNILRDTAPKVPILALTATASNTIRDDIVKSLGMKNEVRVISSFNRPNLYLSIKRQDNIEDDLSELLSKHKNDSKIIYTKTRDSTEKISSQINKLGCNSLAYHAGLNPKKRKEIQDKFMTNKVNTIVATIAFGMGINHKNIRLIIHYGCSNDIESYYQEIGRAGRDGLPSECHMFYCLKDFNLSRFFLKSIVDKEKKNYKSNQIKAVQQFVNSNECRKCTILNYLGEKCSDKCGNCDNCCRKSDTVSVNCTRFAQLLFKLIDTMEIKYGTTKYISILRGSKSKQLTKEMFQLDEYNKGKNKSEKWWKEFISILIMKEYIINNPIKNSPNCTLDLEANAYDILVNDEQLELDVSNEFMKL